MNEHREYYIKKLHPDLRDTIPFVPHNIHKPVVQYYFNITVQDALSTKRLEYFTVLKLIYKY